MDTRELEQFVKNILGDSAARIEGFRQEQFSRIADKIGEIARDAVADEIAVLRSEVETLGHRLATLEKRLENEDDRA